MENTHTISWDIIGIFSGLLLIFRFFLRFSTAPQAFFNSTGGLSGHKRSLLEGGVRSPSMVRWPGGLANPGRSSELPWAFWDVLPTVQDRDGSQFSLGFLGHFGESDIKNGSKRQTDMTFSRV